jgi:hypothetical protein
MSAGRVLALDADVWMMHDCMFRAYQQVGFWRQSCPAPRWHREAIDAAFRWELWKARGIR